VKLPATVARDAVVRRLIDAERALKQATNVQQVKLLMNVAAAQKVFAARQQLGEDVIGYAHALKIHALARLGELLRDLPKAAGARAGGKKDSPRGTYVAPRDSAPTLADLGINKKTSAIAQELAALPPSTREAIAQQEVGLTKALRDRKQSATRDERHARPLPAGLFKLLYVDPPWRYEHVETESRAIENQYPTMSLDDICALRVPSADDCVLFLWATSPKLAEALRVVEAWGFSYRTCAVWDKEVIGMGYYFRQQHELLLVAARGALPVPEPSARVSSVIRARRGAHSEKPARVYELLEAMYPAFKPADRAELFARRQRPGWTTWSNEPAVAS
jgi:N6-adenosine-specific RNA methylase IME4